MMDSLCRKRKLADLFIPCGNVCKTSALVRKNNPSCIRESHPMECTWFLMSVISFQVALPPMSA